MYLDSLLVQVTLANTAVLVADPEPVTKAIFLTSEIVVSAADVLVTYSEISYVHWIDTGEVLTKDNMFDWSPRP